MSEEEVTLKIEGTKHWYGVVYRLHSQAAIANLIEQFLLERISVPFHSCSWWISVRKYCQIAIAKYTKHDSQFYT